MKKKILFILLLLAAFVASQAQKSYSKPYIHVNDTSEDFSRPYPAKTIFFIADSNKFYKTTVKYNARQSMYNVFTDGSFELVTPTPNIMDSGNDLAIYIQNDNQVYFPYGIYSVGNTHSFRSSTFLTGSYGTYVSFVMPGTNNEPRLTSYDKGGNRRRVLQFYPGLRINDSLFIDYNINGTGDFLTVDGNAFVRRRTASEVLLDIGAASTTSYSNLSARIGNDSTNLANNHSTTTEVNGLINDSLAGIRQSINNLSAQTNILYQGVSWDSSTDTYQRLGSLHNIATSQSAGNDYLPIQSDMRRCLLNDDGTVNYYIDAVNPLMKDGQTVQISDTTDGTGSFYLIDSGADFITDGVEAGQYVLNVTDSTYSMIRSVDNDTLTLASDIIISGEVYQVGTANYGGTDGQVMTEIPKFYQKQTLISTTFSWYISKYDLPGFEIHPAFWKNGQEVDYRYYSAFEGSMFDASAGALVDSSNIEVSMYASGDKMCSVAGTWAKTNEQRTEYRTMASERGDGFRQLDYYLHSAVQLLYLIEYADFNSQSMIGNGRTSLSGGTFIADSYIGMTGLSIQDGNNSNSVSNGGTSGYLSDYMTYRGIENFFGNVWKMLDGITWDGRWTGVESSQPLYVTNNSDDFADEGSNNMTHLCDADYIGTTSGYSANIKDVIGFIPSFVGASSTTKLTDYYYQYSEAARDYWRLVRVGGNADAGGKAGVFSLVASSAWSYADAYFGSRLCY